MKDLSFFLLKNSMGAKMKKSFRNFCKGDSSTSTRNQDKPPCEADAPSLASSSALENDNNIGAVVGDAPRKSVTLEEMILQLELEEEMARRAKLDVHNRRMSCVNNSDILRSARKALNQYPRFSLDGKDSMYQFSFRNNLASFNRELDSIKLGKLLDLPESLGGESVVWCKPGVVPKLMGLEAMPVPVSRAKRQSAREKLSDVIRNQNLRRRAERHELDQRRRRFMDLSGCGNVNYGKIGSMSSCSRMGHCLMKPISMEPVDGDKRTWPSGPFM
ncbi:hypothetical protein Ancab_019560 [Ancistrocladus abbreviatus]